MFKSQGTLRQHLTKVKTVRPELRKRSVIYEVPCIPCMDCDSKYIGDRKKLTESLVSNFSCFTILDRQYLHINLVVSVHCSHSADEGPRTETY